MDCNRDSNKETRIIKRRIVIYAFRCLCICDSLDFRRSRVVLLSRLSTIHGTNVTLQRNKRTYNTLLLLQNISKLCARMDEHFEYFFHI